MTDAEALLDSRCAAVPELLQRVLCDLPGGWPQTPAPPTRADLRFAESAGPQLRYVITGIGTSEGPARLLAYLLGAHAGVRARFAPLSALAGADLESPQPLSGADAVLVVFSQGLSPNAQLALAQRARFATLLLYTSVPMSDARVQALVAAGAHVTVLPPAGEDRLFLRVLGPAVAQLAAAQLADALARRGGRAAGLPLAAAVQAAAAGPARARASLARLGAARVDGGEPTGAARTSGPGAPGCAVAFVTSGGYGELCLGLRWKLLEGAGVAEPAAWDLLQVAHGPLQQTFARPLLLCALLRGEDPIERALLRRLRAVLPPHHLVLPLEARLRGPLALLEHDVQCNELLRAVRCDRSWDLLDWPGRHCDGPLYALSDAGELAGDESR